MNTSLDGFKHTGHYLPAGVLPHLHPSVPSSRVARPRGAQDRAADLTVVTGLKRSARAVPILVKTRQTLANRREITSYGATASSRNVKY